MTNKPNPPARLSESKAPELDEWPLFDDEGAYLFGATEKLPYRLSLTDDRPAAEIIEDIDRDLLAAQALRECLK